MVTFALIGLNVVAFLYELAQGPATQALIADYAFVPQRLSLALGGGDAFGPTALTVLSSMFLHGGWAHLLGNMWYLWIFGDNIEDRLGPFGFVAFYLASGIVACLLHYASHTDSRIPTLGASGAIAGVLGGYLVTCPRARVVTLVPLFPFFQVVALPAVFVLGLWFVYQFVLGTLSIGGSGGGVAWWAHIGGFAFGALAMALIGRLQPRRSYARVEG